MNFCDLFKKKTQQIPGNVAVQYQNFSLSYQELDCLSSELAKRLIKNGLNSGDVVGLGLYNSTNLLIGLLGILKAGGVYLPLDPNYPTERIKEMVFDSAARLIIVDPISNERFNTIPVSLYFIEQDKNECSLDLLPNISPDQSAYIIYTSGSTGRPKGIVVSHKALSHAALSFSRVCSSPSCSLLSGSISFDPSILIIIHALCIGGKVCLYDNREGIDLKDFKQIIRVIKDCSVDFILSTPSFYSGILREKQILESIKNVFLCGEKIHHNLIREHGRFVPNANLYNTYGPSEYAIGSTAGIIYNAVTKQDYPITIGRPFHNNKIYVLNSELKPLAPGQKGEFFVGGPGLASGYLNQKALTDNKFIVCNHLGKKSVRLYQTGDIGFRLENGDYVFSGRKDFQVKINGHRVELEEIEAIALEFSSIDKAIVLVKNEKLLIFYSSKEKTVQIDDLKKHLEKILPPYMIPNIFIEVEHWPITNNGKIDRKALVLHWLSK